MAANSPPPPPPEEWLTEGFRLTAFPVTPAFESSRGWWSSLTGTDPESSTEKRQKLEREDAGPFHGCELTLAVDLLRVQWAVTPRVADNPQDRLPEIGRFVDQREWFRDLMCAWLQECPSPIKRVAFGGVLIQPVASHQGAYERLNQYLRKVELDTAASDFLFRINRRRPSTVVPGMAINRLGSWSALKRSRRNIVLEMGETEKVQTFGEILDERYACRYEFDINTPADRLEAIPAADLSRLFAEFADMALEFATHGDGAL